MTDDRRISLHTRDHVLMIGLDRAAKRNAFDLAMLRQLAEAMTTYEDDPALRCAVIHAHGEHFTAGLDLAEVGPAVARGEPLFPAGAVDPLGLYGRVRTKPLIMAAQGWCLTIGIELLLAADIRIAAADARFGQIEIRRGIFPFGGATLRLPQVAGWGNAMRWLLTGDEFDAATALRLGFVQELVELGCARSRARALATSIAEQAPLAVRATRDSARIALDGGCEAAVAAFSVQLPTLAASDDFAEGVRSFVERRAGRYVGR